MESQSLPGFNASRYIYRGREGWTQSLGFKGDNKSPFYLYPEAKPKGISLNTSLQPTVNELDTILRIYYDYSTPT